MDPARNHELAGLPSAELSRTTLVESPPSTRNSERRKQVIVERPRAAVLTIPPTEPPAAAHGHAKVAARASGEGVSEAVYATSTIPTLELPGHAPPADGDPRIMRVEPPGHSNDYPVRETRVAPRVGVTRQNARQVADPQLVAGRPSLSDVMHDSVAPSLGSDVFGDEAPDSGQARSRIAPIELSDEARGVAACSLVPVRSYPKTGAPLQASFG